MKVNVRLFGAFRRFGEELSLDVGEGVGVAELRRAIGDGLKSREPTFDGEGLLASAAIADEEAVLGPDSRIAAGAKLALLPPVCGG